MANNPDVASMNAVEGALSAIAFRANEVAFHQGDRADHWYEVASGVVRTCRFLVDGHRHLTGFYFPGDVIGTSAERFPASAEAVTPCTLISHPRNETAALSIPSERALESAERYVALLGHRSATERIAAFILQISRRPTLGDRVPLPMSRSDIADHLGLTIHTISRTLTDLARRRVVVPDGRFHLRILDRDALNTLACEPEAVTSMKASTPILKGL